MGNDWAEAHHDVCLLDEDGTKLAVRRLPEGLGVWPACMRWSPSRYPTQLRWWSGSRPTVDCGLVR